MCKWRFWWRSAIFLRYSCMVSLFTLASTNSWFSFFVWLRGWTFQTANICSSTQASKGLNKSKLGIISEEFSSFWVIGKMSSMTVYLWPQARAKWQWKITFLGICLRILLRSKLDYFLHCRTKTVVTFLYISEKLAIISSKQNKNKNKKNADSFCFAFCWS